MADELLDLAHAVENAREWLVTAGQIACRLDSDDDGKPLGWKEMDAVASKLVEAVNGLVSILDPLAAAIKEAADYQDHMADLADGQSY